MKRKDQPCVCCGRDVRQCDCLWDAQICYRCGCCKKHCICTGGIRTGVIYCEGERDGFHVEVRG